MPVLERGGGGDHLERRARHVALLVGVREQRLLGEAVEEREHLFGLGGVVHCDVVRVEGRPAVHGQHASRAGVEHHDRALSTPEQFTGLRLQVGAQRDAHRAALIVVAVEQIGEPAELLTDVGAGEDPVRHPFELGGPECERVVAGDVGEQVFGGVFALVVEPVVGGDRTGDHHAVGRHDLTPRAVELLDDLTVVPDVAAQLFVASDLQHVELHEQHEVTREQPGCEPADLAVHRSVPTTTVASAPASALALANRLALRFSCQVGSSGSSPKRRADESLMRISRASSR